MPAFSAVWAIVLAVLLAGGLLAVMMVVRRPKEGWRNRLSDLVRGERVGGPGIVEEHRAAADGETVGIADLLADAEQADGYVTVPARVEHGIEHGLEAIVSSSRALAGRVRGDSHS